MRSVLNSGVNQVPKLKVLNLSGESIPVEENGSFQVLDASALIFQDSTAFLHDYRNLMGMMSMHMHSRLWWATHIASKNRFTSRMPILLQQIESCKKEINEDYGTLIIYKPDISYTSTLNDLCILSGKELSYPHWYVRTHFIKERLRSLMSLIKSCITLLYKFSIVRLFYKSKLENDSDHKLLC